MNGGKQGLFVWQSLGQKVVVKGEVFLIHPDVRNMLSSLLRSLQSNRVFCEELMVSLNRLIISENLGCQLETGRIR